jgi:hypothetical protein
VNQALYAHINNKRKKKAEQVKGFSVGEKKLF